MRLTFLGCGDAFGSGGRFQACLLVEAGGRRLLLDCGASSLIAMRQQDVDPASIDAIVVSHLHGDHFGGLPFFLLDGQFRRGARPLTIAGPPGVERRVLEAMEVLFPGASAVTRRFPTTFVELGSGPPTVVAGATVSAYRVVHPSGAPPLAVRLEADGRILAYSGDTEWTDALVEVARGADVFVCEAYTLDRRVKFHLDWRTLDAHRARLECGRLILTHLGPEMLARLDEVPVEAARDGLSVEV